MTDLPPSKYFPPLDTADEDGLLGFGGRLTPDWLLDAYRHGIFPWPAGDDDLPIPWWSPDPRAVLALDGLHVSRSLQRTLRRGGFTATCDRDFPNVIRGCASAPGRPGATWLTPAMIRAYTQLHDLGHAHSVEVWREGRLAGGAYGVSIGGFFAAESMFHRVTDASKVALVHLVRHLRARGYVLLDIQQLTPHTQSLGAIEIARKEYLARLAAAQALPVTFGTHLESRE